MLYSHNHAFIKNRLLPIANEEEVMLNVSIKLGVPIAETNAPKSAFWGNLFLGSLGLAITIVMTYVIIRLIASLVEVRTNASLGDLLYFGLLFLGVISSCYYSYHCLRTAYFRAGVHSPKQKETFTSLIRHGAVLEGLVVSVLPAEPGIRIQYRFLNSASKNIEGYYSSFTSHVIKPNDKVNILYLNDNIHILI